MKKPILMAATALLTALGVSATDELPMLVGTYTGSGSKGIYSFRFNQATGEALLLDSAEAGNPSYLAVSADGRMVYAVNEYPDAGRAALSSFRFDPSSGRLTFVNKQPTGGGDPCHVETDGQIAVTANYTRGSMSVFPLMPDGALGQRINLFEGHACAVAAAPRNVPHVHMARFTRDGYILATDFSADRLLCFRVKGRRVTPLGVGGTLPPGAAPRHIALSDDEKHVYVLGELGGTVTVFARRKGRLRRLQTVVSDSVGGRGGADIHLSADGRYLYASNRLKADGISVFRVDRRTGLLQKTGYRLTGLHPRNFIITPNDRYLLCACRDSNAIQVYERDAATGMLTLRHTIDLPKPVCIRFAPVR